MWFFYSSKSAPSNFHRKLSIFYLLFKIYAFWLIMVMNYGEVQRWRLLSKVHRLRIPRIRSRCLEEDRIRPRYELPLGNHRLPASKKIINKDINTNGWFCQQSGRHQLFKSCTVGTVSSSVVVTPSISLEKLQWRYLNGRNVMLCIYPK